MRTSPKRHCCQLASILAFSAATVISVPVLAAEKELVLEEVVVTARKQEESSQSVPIAITAISKELESSTIRNLTDLNGFAPNVQIGEDGSRGGGGASIAMRGISPTRTDDNSFDAPIAVMVDGIYLGSLAGQVIENFDLERIEILRGPQGTLFGKNTVGGVINVIRTRPTGEFGAKLKATLGEDGMQEFRAVVNTSLIEDKLALKLFATTIEDDGLIKNITTGADSGAKDYKNFGATFLWTPNDRFEASLTIENLNDTSLLNAYHTNYNLGPGVLPAPDDITQTDRSGGFLSCTIFPQICRMSLDTPGVAEANQDNNAELDTDAITLNMRYDLTDNLTLVSVTGARDMTEYRIYDFDASSADFITIERWNDYEQFSQELRLDGNWDNVTLTAGLYYWNSEFTQDWVTAGPFWAILIGGVIGPQANWELCQAGVFDPLHCDRGLASFPADDNQILFETQETTSVAAFAQVDWTFAEDWTLTAGLRWTEEEKVFRAGQAYHTSTGRARLRNFPTYSDLDRTWTEVSPKLGLTYQINDNSMVYASYSEGFHSGGFFGVNQNIRDFERDQYQPEFAESLEVGYKSMLFNNRLRLNATFFQNDFIDKQESAVEVDPDTSTVQSVFRNAADAEYRGFELETEYLVNEYLRVFLNYGYLDASYKEFITDVNTPTGVVFDADMSHLTPQDAPENTIGVGGTVTIPLGSGAVEIYAKYSRIDEIETDLMNAIGTQADPRKNVTAQIGYFADNWSLAVFGRNLTDERSETFVAVGTLFGAGSLNRGRTIGAEFAYEF